MLAQWEVEVYVYTFSNLGARRGGWLTPRPGCLTFGERHRVPIVQEAGWAPGPVWTSAENLFPPPGFDPLTIQPVASRLSKCTVSYYI